MEEKIAIHARQASMSQNVYYATLTRQDILAHRYRDRVRSGGGQSVLRRHNLDMMNPEESE